MTLTDLHENPASAERDRDGRFAVRLENVTKYFFKGSTRITAIENINLKIEKGAFVTLVGPSGCGKTTLFNCIAGFITPERGAVVYNGRKIRGPNVGIGYMTQRDALLPWRSVISNVMLPFHIQRMNPKEARQRALEVIDRVGLSGFAEHYPAELSGGMQKRTALARMLAFNPDTFLMDEPFGNLDLQLKLQLHRQLLSLWEQERKTVVFVTHDLEEAIALSDKIVVLQPRPGRIKKILDVDLPRPRDPVSIRFDPAFQRLNKELWELVEAENDHVAGRD